MALTVETDPHSGFCGGVIRAIGSAERFLSEHPDRTLYSLGSIVHNEEELARLSGRGLVTVSTDDLPRLAEAGGGDLLIRAHGEPPSTYERAAALGFRVVDCTCPVVLKLQKDIVAAHRRLHRSGKAGQVVIFGRIGHAEVLGLVGQVGGDAVVVEDAGMLRSFLEDGTISREGKIELFSQTTKSPEEYARVRDLLAAALSDPADLTVHDTICSQVALRHRNLSDFARSHDIVVFVSGRTSSNGSVLFNLCKSLNDRTFQVCSEAEVRPEWFRPGDRVGVSGATSTPRWLLEQVATHIASLNV